MSSKIVLNRKGEWMTRAKIFKVFIDGAQVGEIKNNSAEEYIVEPGQHVVQCKVSWCLSKETTVDVSNNETLFLRVRTGLKYYLPLYFVMIAGLIFPIFYKIAGVQRPQWTATVQLVMILPGLLYIIYYLTLNRKNYLSVEKDTSNPFST